MSNRVIIDQTTNTVSTDQCPEIHNSVVVNNDVPSTIDVIENITNIVTVTVPGPQGSQGLIGPSGSQGPAGPSGSQGPAGPGADITGSQYYVPLFKNATGLVTSSIYQSGSFTSIRNATSPEDPANPDILYVNGDGVDTYNLISAHGNKNSYIQINVKNYNSSTEASSDIVATADNGTESSNYIDMGINSSGFTNTGNVGGQNDAYVYSTGNDLYIGNASPGKQIIIFNGGLDAANQAKVWIHDQGTVGINTDTYNTTNPPSLQVNAPNDTTYNIAQFFGNTDNYAQVGITNANIGTTASADLVLYNNIDYENQLAGFVDLGINSTNYVYNGVYPGSAGDAYLFTDSEHLVIGSVSGSGAAKITLFAGGISESDNAKLVLYGNNKHQMTGSLSATEGFSGSLFGTASWALNTLTASYVPNAVSSSYPIAVTGSTIYSFNAGIPSGDAKDGSIFLGARAGSQATDSYFSNFLGEDAGNQAVNAYISNFIGWYAGFQATNAQSSNFIGDSAGNNARNSYFSNFIGTGVGRDANDSNESNFIGTGTGYGAYSSSYSNFIGRDAGLGSDNTRDSNFIGRDAGRGAPAINYSNFFGYQAGFGAESSSYSTLIGYRVGYVPNINSRILSNNIIIGTNITLPLNRRDSINLGGLIFGTGSYSTITGNPFSGSANGRVGINQPLPLFSLDVSGSGRYTNGLTVSSSLIAPSITGSLQGTASWALNALTASFGGNFTASNALITNTLTAQTLVVQTVTSSIEFVTGSTRFGSLLTNTHQFTGSVSITGSLSVNNSPVILTSQTGSMSVASASLAATASYVPASAVVGLNLSQISSGSISASVNTDISASFRITSASNTLLNVTKDGQVWVGNGSFVNQGYQADIQGTGRFNATSTGITGYTLVVRDSNSTNGSSLLLNFSGGVTSSILQSRAAGFRLYSDNSKFYFGANFANGNIVLGGTEVDYNFDRVNVFNLNSTTTDGIGISIVDSSGTIGNGAGYNFVASNKIIASIRSTINSGYNNTGLRFLVGNSASVLTEIYRITETQNILIGSTTNIPSAIVGISSTTKGFLLPRMTSTERISVSSPAQGLQVYDTGSSTEGIWYYSSGSIKSWTRLLNDTGSQSISGSLTATQGFTGSLFGTASWALNALTASFLIGGASSAITVADEGTAQGTATFLNFVGAGVTVTVASNTASINISGGAGAAFPFTGSAQITGSLGVTGSVAITGSLNVGSTNIEYQENTNVTTGTWRVVSSEPTASYRAAFFDYVMFSGSIARAGTVYSVWSASYAEYYENYTGDVGGSTSGVTLQAAISGSNIQLQATSSNNSWTIRSLVRML